MRVNPNLVPDILAAVAQTQQQEATALQEMSSGKRVTVPSDDPAAAAAMVQVQRRSDSIDQYTSNSSTVLGLLQTADSALSSVVTELNQAVSLGTEGANGTLSTANRQALGQQVQDILANVVSNANLSYKGVYLFAGTNTTQVPFTANSGSPAGYSYNGNSNVNSVAIGESLSIPTNVPGDQLFQNSNGNVLESLQQLATALQTGTQADIGTATNAVSQSLSYLSQQRVFYGNTMSQVNSQESFLQNESVNIKSQENSLVGADLAQVAIMFSQAQTAHDAALAAAARVLPTTLLDYLK